MDTEARKAISRVKARFWRNVEKAIEVRRAQSHARNRTYINRTRQSVRERYNDLARWTSSPRNSSYLLFVQLFREFRSLLFTLARKTWGRVSTKIKCLESFSHREFFAQPTSSCCFLAGIDAIFLLLSPIVYYSICFTASGVGLK